LPDYWNAQDHLWRSRLEGLANGTLRVQHLPEPGRTVLVGGQAYRIVAGNDTALADGNPPWAGMALRFQATVRRIVFAGGGSFPQAPDARLATLDGRLLNVSDLRGQPVLLDFFATWCLTCKQEAPILARAHAAFPGLAVVSVTIDPSDNPPRVRAFQQDAERAAGQAWGEALPANWTWAFDPAGQAAQAYSVAGIPREVLLDGEGRVRATSQGFHAWDELRAEVAALPP
jgi:cytochrome c biogenesis protein CcmG/thiol:disulfide interchange protein DsbE